MIIEPELSATSQRKVPLDASTHPVNANNKIAAHFLRPKSPGTQEVNEIGMAP
jgi:hypothetical protein